MHSILFRVVSLISSHEHCINIRCPHMKPACLMRVNHYRPQRSWGKVMFLQVCVILFTGGEYLTRYTPRTRYTPQTRYTPRDQVHPWDQVHPPLDQVHPPRPGTPPRTRYTPRTRYPLDQVHPPPRTRYTPPRQVPPGPCTPTPPDQVHSPQTGTPPDQVHPPKQVHLPPRRGACGEIRSTRGRYAPYWNAFFFILICVYSYQSSPMSKENSINVCIVTLQGCKQ